MPRLPFTEYEAVLLLDAYLKTLSGEMGRMEAVRECSTQLRQMALNAGTEIDATYRNENVTMLSDTLPEMIVMHAVVISCVLFAQ